MDVLTELKSHLDEQGKLKLFPAKRRIKFIALMYLSTNFKPDVVYTEKEVNEIIEQNHSFQDKWLLRRELIDKGFLERLTDGSRYWMSEKQPTLKDYGFDE